MSIDMSMAQTRARNSSVLLFNLKIYAHENAKFGRNESGFVHR